MPIVIDPPEAPPLPPPSEDASELWELVYQRMGPFREDDHLTGFQLREACECLCAPYQDVYDLIREREGMKGWTILFDPRLCPEKWLPYLAQFVGVQIQPQMTVAQIRAEIERPTAWRRGEPETIELVAQRGQDVAEGEEAWIRIRPRTPSAGHTYIRTLLNETPDPIRKEAELRAAIPAWELLDYEAIEGVSWADVEASWEGWGDLEESVPGWEAVADLLPDELPE
ncbi:MAG TPA: hypothetical protein VI039_12915 [Solirubrobacterales bacterium]